MKEKSEKMLKKPNYLTVPAAFGLNEGNVRYQAKEIGNVLQNQ